MYSRLGIHLQEEALGAPNNATYICNEALSDLSSRSLSTLSVGDTVLVQDQKINGGQAGQLIRTGIVTKGLPDKSYIVAMDGSRHVTKRN